MPDKYLYNAAGTVTEKAAIDTSTGAGDAGKVIAADSTGRMDPSFLPPGIGADTASVTSSENLAAGDFVNVYNSSGAKCRKADASTTGKEAHGFVISAVTSPANATVYFEGSNTQVSAAVPGPVYLSDSTPGGFTSIAPSGTGKIVQLVGVATSATSINFERGMAIALA